MTGTNQNFRKEATELPPEDFMFLSGVLQALTAMYCRLHPLPAQTEAEKREEIKKEETT